MLVWLCPALLKTLCGAPVSYSNFWTHMWLLAPLQLHLVPYVLSISSTHFQGASGLVTVQFAHKYSAEKISPT